ITGHLIEPIGKGPFPAVVFNHSHGGTYEHGAAEVFHTAAERPGVIPDAESPALAFVRRGYAVLAVDTYAFGARAGAGPKPDEVGNDGEHTLFKTFLWLGRSMWGMMVRDDLVALDWLCAQPQIDATRIAATGLSMGSTRSWWMAALDDRVHAMVGVCCLTRYTELVRAGALWEHGMYYFVPGMLRHFDSEAVVALIAPRPCLMLNGARDGGSPAPGIRRIDRVVRRVYRLYGSPGSYRSIIYPGVGHTYTPEMWRETLAWLDAALRPVAPAPARAHRKSGRARAR
ncbi:MAG: dienelactone hydrolase family protein, partial [Planctomycetes bacterium]|nr:dienelactone hydrolase family protein [Planctomycetota bacterium]